MRTGARDRHPHACRGVTPPDPLKEEIGSNPWERKCRPRQRPQPSQSTLRRVINYRPLMLICHIIRAMSCRQTLMKANLSKQHVCGPGPAPLRFRRPWPQAGPTAHRSAGQSRVWGRHVPGVRARRSASDRNPQGHGLATADTWPSTQCVMGCGASSGTRNVRK